MARKEEIINILSKFKEGPKLVSMADHFVEMVETQEQFEGKLTDSEMEYAVCSVFVMFFIQGTKKMFSKQISVPQELALTEKLVQKHGMNIDSIMVRNAVMNLNDQLEAPDVHQSARVALLEGSSSYGGRIRKPFILSILGVLFIVLIFFVVSQVWKSQPETTERQGKAAPNPKKSETVKTSTKKMPIFKPPRPKMLLNRPDMEIAGLNKIINSGEKNAKALYNRGLFYASKGDLKKALMDYNSAIEFDKAKKRRLAGTPNVDNEIETLNNIIDSDERNTKAFFNRGLFYASKGDLKKALMDYNRSIELKSSDADAYYNRAIIYIRMNKFNEAIKDFTETINLNPKSTDAYCNRGNAYSQTDKIALAIKDYDAALKIDPNDGVVYYNRARAHFAIQNRKKVVADLENAAKYAGK